jgi:hypothetical protein
VISIKPSGEVDLDGRDTELALRRSQIERARPLLEKAEAIAAEKAAAERAASQPPAVPSSTGRATPIAHVPAADRDAKPWVWPVIAVVAIALCIVLGVLLAFK